MRTLTSLAAIVVLLSPSPARSCTTFALGQGKSTLVGKSYDWHFGDGLLFINPRGVERVGFVVGAAPRRWRSRFGSVTFNQYGHGHPNGGINEKGLVVEVMWQLDSTTDATPGRGQAAVNELQLVQLLLDSGGSLKEAIAIARRQAVARIHGRIHYLVCDASGACAAIEHNGGRATVHHGSALPRRALTNHSYKRLLAYYRGLKGKPVPSGKGSLQRFARVARADNEGKAASPTRALELLKQVQVGRYTKWQILYQSSRRVVTFRHAITNRAHKIDLNKINFACSTGVRVADLQGSIFGDGKQRAYRLEHSMRLLKIASKRLNLPAMLLAQARRHPAFAVPRCNAR